MVRKTVTQRQKRGILNENGRSKDARLITFEVKLKQEHGYQPLVISRSYFERRWLEQYVSHPVRLNRPLAYNSNRHFSS